ncbi:MAG: CDP-archaeol synthase [Gammaproteobacteria bacterium]|nr:CDP-archaeol synthase [Gammaproteobacteria bacterium]
MFSSFTDLLLLILVANGTPVIARNLLGRKFNLPLDLRRVMSDGFRLLGDSKTWRGLMSSLLITALVAKVMGYSFFTGFLIAFFSLTGDLFSSFIKRRLGKASSSRFLILDQVPEALLPAAVMAPYFQLQWYEVIMLTLLFLVLELLMSRLMYRIGLRRKPY